MPDNSRYPFRKIQLSDIVNVGAGKTVLISCPKGPRYKYIGLQIGNTAAGNGNAPTAGAIIDQINIILGSGVQRHVTGANLDIINKAMGKDADYSAQAVITGGANGTGRTIVPIFFEEPWRKRLDYQDGLAWQTGFLGTNDVFQLQVKLQGGITPDLTAFAVVDDFYNGKGPHPIMKWSSEDAPTTSSIKSLENILQGYPKDDMLSQISLMQTSDAQTISAIRMLMNKEVIMDDITSQQQLAELIHYGMNPDTAGAAYHVPFDHDDKFESLRRVGDIASSSLKLTFGGASNGTITRVTQRLGLPE